MASSFVGVVFLVLVLSTQTAEGKNNNFNLAMASRNLSDKGYHAMSSMILDVLFKNHMNVSGNSTFTVFCPPDDAFSSKNPQPPLTLLQYHVVPQKLESGNLSSLPHGSKIDTLLPGHPLVVTTLPNDNYTSINEVKVTQWNLYNDGGLTIHAVNKFLMIIPVGNSFVPFYFPDPVSDTANENYTQVSSSGFSWLFKQKIGFFYYRHCILLVLGLVLLCP